LNATLTYDKANHLIEQGIVKTFMVEGQEILMAVIFKCRIGRDLFAVVHALRRNHEKKQLEFISPEVVRVISLADGREVYGPVTRGEVTKIMKMLEAGKAR